MAKKMAKTLAKAQKKRNARARVTAAGAEGTAEHQLLRLITDPCNAPLVHGFSMSSEGIVQRFIKYVTPVATTETAFAYIWSPMDQTNTGLCEKVSVGSATPTGANIGGPGEGFLENNADNLAMLGGCIEVLYTGKLVDRKGYIGVCQVNGLVAADIRTGTTPLPTLIQYCQHVAPVPSSSVTLKWSPTLTSFTQNLQVNETNSVLVNTNSLMVVAVGVNPADFVIKFTGVYEYVPKFTLGMPAPRVTRTVRPGTGERIVSALDRMGAWWHNLEGMASAVGRLGGAATNAILASSSAYQQARRLAGPATALLALTG